ncbi:MAG TPA: cysteine--tRNA ligase [Acidimicrobiales bacterium]|nr:cysteine--tRNA ligase [Acidimicrobiales bacterium]
MTDSMRLWDTLRREVVPFDPPHTVNFYVCGITPYDSTHVGHAATMLLYDLVERRLRDRGHEVRSVRNVTDVDDSILGRAAELGVNYLDLGLAGVRQFEEDMGALSVLPSWKQPRATSVIPQILSAVADLLDKGFAYVSDGSVYFSSGSYEQFGQLSRLDRPEMLHIAAERGGAPDDPAKRDPLDFVLWQKARPGEPSWESQWGPGRPGWHIECTAMAMDNFGPQIHLHGGGADLVFPHHECERAQSDSLAGRTTVHHWLHQAMVRYEGEKMSKSLGNLVFIRDLREKFDPRAIRLGIISHHYRTAWEYDDGDVPLAADHLARWEAAGEGDGALAEVRERLDDDLDSPGAVAAINEAVSRGEGVTAAARLLGIELEV